jgi:hypothetical protein
MKKQLKKKPSIDNIYNEFIKAAMPLNIIAALPLAKRVWEAIMVVK